MFCVKPLPAQIIANDLRDIPTSSRTAKPGNAPRSFARNDRTRWTRGDWESAPGTSGRAPPDASHRGGVILRGRSYHSLSHQRLVDLHTSHRIVARCPRGLQWLQLHPTTPHSGRRRSEGMHRTMWENFKFPGNRRWDASSAGRLHERDEICMLNSIRALLAPLLTPLWGE
jgi:hypothetical protein